MLTIICIIHMAETSKSALQNSALGLMLRAGCYPLRVCYWMVFGCFAKAFVSLLFAVAEEARGNLRVLDSVLGTLIATDFCSFPPKLFTFCPI